MIDVTWIAQQWQWLTTVAIATLLLALLLLELQSVARLRRLLNRELARIFEQLDLVRLDGLQWRDAAMPTGVAPQPAARAIAAASAAPQEMLMPQSARAATQVATAREQDYRLATELATRGLDAHDIAQRCEISPAEARLLVAMHGRRST